MIPLSRQTSFFPCPWIFLPGLESLQQRQVPNKIIEVRLEQTRGEEHVDVLFYVFGMLNLLRPRGHEDVLFLTYSYSDSRWTTPSGSKRVEDLDL